MEWDVFISHAGEDKAEVALPLANLLIAAGLRVWLDKNELHLRDSLRAKIDEGLANSRFGIVILSKAFFEKDWPQRELNGLAALEIRNRKVILPVWHKIDHEFVTRYSPLLADRLAISTDQGLEAVKTAVLDAVSNTENKAARLQSSTHIATRADRSKRAKLIALGAVTLLALISIGKIFLLKLAPGRNLPPYLKDIVRGLSVGKCSAENTAVQRFQHGWLVGHFLSNGTDYFYAVVDMGKNDLRWFRTTSDKNEREPPIQCPGVRGEHLLRWGFRRWYCSQDETAGKIRRLLGEPTTLETAVWAQYQQWSEGLLVVGIPTTENDFKAGKYASLVNVFMEEGRSEESSLGRHDRGWGHFNTVTAYNIPDCKVYCNAVWYYAPTGIEEGQKLIAPTFENETGCVRKHSQSDFLERDVCSLCLN